MQDETAIDAAPDPSVLGRLTEDEHAALLNKQSEARQLLIKIGEYEVLKQRALVRLAAIEEEGQSQLGAITARLGLLEGQTWYALADGTIRLAEPGQGSTVASVAQAPAG